MKIMIALNHINLPPIGGMIDIIKAKTEPINSPVMLPTIKNDRERIIKPATMSPKSTSFFTF